MGDVRAVLQGEESLSQGLHSHKVQALGSSPGLSQMQPKGLIAPEKYILLIDRCIIVT